MNVGQVFKTYGGWLATLVYQSARNEKNGQVFLFVHHVEHNVIEDESHWHYRDGTRHLDNVVSNYDVIISTGA